MMKTEKTMKVYTLSFESSYDCGVLGIYSSKENAEAEAKILREKNDDLEDDYGWLTIREVSLDAAAEEPGDLTLGDEV